jgi:subtilisin family serine protease
VTRAAAIAAVGALVLPGPAAAARFAVGLADGASPVRVAARVERVTGGRVSLDQVALRALILDGRGGGGVRRLPGVTYVERLDARRPLAFATPDPLAARQWYLGQIRAFDAWVQPPALGPVRVAIVDSGIDGDHPEFANRIATARSFVGGSARTDQQGHGTFVAGLIAAAHDGAGIAGIAFPAQLAIAKVVGRSPDISLDAEVRAIRWAVDSAHAQVINLSFAGLRDPLDPTRDTFSPLEASAIDYASRRGVVVVAAVGNSDEAPQKPWPFAAYPAALPHVLGVSAISRDGTVPLFSARDQIFNDITAPGKGILSTFPRVLSRAAGCADPGYSDCAVDGLGIDRQPFRRGEGTSFAAPQVAAAAALVLAARPTLTPDQVTTLLTRTAEDITPAEGCEGCARFRDPLTGWGRLDVAAAVRRALDGRVPQADRRETNDEAGSRASTLWGPRGGTIEASIDFWDDQNDVYRVRLRQRQRIVARLPRGPDGTKLFLWKPGTTRVDSAAPALQRRRLARSHQVAGVQQIAFRAPRRRGGWYFLQVRIEQPGAGRYTLHVGKR